MLPCQRVWSLQTTLNASRNGSLHRVAHVAGEGDDVEMDRPFCMLHAYKSREGDGKGHKKHWEEEGGRALNIEQRREWEPVRERERERAIYIYIYIYIYIHILPLLRNSALSACCVRCVLVCVLIPLIIFDIWWLSAWSARHFNICRECIGWLAWMTPVWVGLSNHDLFGTSTSAINLLIDWLGWLLSDVDFWINWQWLQTDLFTWSRCCPQRAVTAQNEKTMHTKCFDGILCVWVGSSSLWPLWKWWMHAMCSIPFYLLTNHVTCAKLVLL